MAAHLTESVLHAIGDLFVFPFWLAAVKAARQNEKKRWEFFDAKIPQGVEANILLVAMCETDNTYKCKATHTCTPG